MAKDSISIKEYIKERFDSTDEDLKEIKEHVQKTNGRVNSLEVSRGRIIAVISVLMVLGATMSYLIIGAIDNKIQTGISQALAAYED